MYKLPAIERERRADLLRQVERLTELPLLVLSLAIVPLIVVPMAVDLSAPAERAVLAADWAIWAAFALELTVKTYLAPERRRYLLHHWYDVIIVAVPFLRPLRVLRSARALRALRSLRFVALLLRATTRVRGALGRHGLGYTLAVAGLVVVGGAAAALALEEGSDGAIDNFGDALWWAAATVTTVGYGDVTPSTAEGRVLGVGLMVVGITVFGLATASIAAMFVASDAKEEHTQLDDLNLRLQRIEELLDRLASREATQLVATPPNGDAAAAAAEPDRESAT